MVEPILVLTSLRLISLFGMLLCVSTLFKDFDLGSLMSKVIEFSDPTSSLQSDRSPRTQVTADLARNRQKFHFDQTGSMNTDDTKVA